MPPPSLTGEVYRFHRRKLILRFGRRVIYNLEDLRVHSEIDSVCTTIFKRIAGLCFYYTSPTSGEAYRDRRLTTNFEL